MPRCKRCGFFGRTVCEVDTNYEEQIRQEMQDLAETGQQIKGIIRRVNNTRRFKETKENKSQPVLDHMKIEEEEKVWTT